MPSERSASPNSLSRRRRNSPPPSDNDGKPNKRSSSRNSHSNRHSSPSRRLSSYGDNHDNRLLEDVYAAADYIRKVLHPKSNVDRPTKTYPINQFALHLICGLPLEENDPVELVSESSDLHYIKKLLEAGDTKKHRLCDIDIVSVNTKTALSLKVLTGSKQGQRQEKASITVLIYNHRNFDGIAVAAKSSYKEMITASPRYDFVETLGLSHCISVLSAQDKEFVKNHPGSEHISPALKTLCDVFYHMMDEEVQRRHSVAYTHEEPPDDNGIRPPKLDQGLQTIVQDETEKLHNIQKHRMRALDHHGAYKILTESFFNKLYAYYRKNVMLLKNKDPIHAQKCHNHAITKVKFFFESFVDGGYTMEDIMPELSKESPYNVAKVLIQLCNYEIDSVVMQGERSHYTDAHKYKTRLNDAWYSVFAIRELIDAYLDPSYFKKYPLNESLPQSQEFVAKLLTEWLRPFRSLTRRDEYQQFFFVNNMVKIYKYFPEESLNYEMHRTLVTDEQEKGEQRLYLVSVVNALLPDDITSEWKFFYGKWEDNMKSKNEKEWSRRGCGNVRALAKILKSKMREKNATRKPGEKSTVLPIREENPKEDKKRKVKKQIAVGKSSNSGGDGSRSVRDRDSKNSRSDRKSSGGGSDAAAAGKRRV